MTWPTLKRLGLMLSLLASLIILSAITLSGVGWNLSDWVGWLYLFVGLIILSPFLIGYALSKLVANTQPITRVNFKPATIVIGCGLFVVFGLLAMRYGLLFSRGNEAPLMLAGAVVVALPFLIASCSQIFRRR